MRNDLPMWTIYDHPRDAPDLFVARKHLIERGFSVATSEAFACKSLEPLRERMLEMGLTCLPRQEGDDPVIVESWI